MTQAVFEALQPTLAALREVKSPPMPVSVALAEASALLSFLNDEASPGPEKPGAAAQAKLVSVGLTVGHVAAFGQALDALRFAQAVHQSKGLRVVDAAHAQSVADAYTLRSDIMAACRWNLRADRIAQGALDRIAEGEGLQDLISDHNALAALIQSHAAAFASDTTFDPDARAESCRQAAANVEALTSGNTTEQDKRDTADARNRAWTHFKALHKSLRDAAEYALRADPHTLSRFTSAYRRKLNKKAKAKAKTQGQ